MQSPSFVDAQYARRSEEFRRVSIAQTRGQRRLADPSLSDAERLTLQRRAAEREIHLSRLHTKMYQSLNLV